MPRPITLSNGSLAVGINNYGLVHDFYFPYVGLENHATSKVLRHRIGVWVDGHFSWLDDGQWACELNYEESALISKITAKNAELGVTLRFRDTIDDDLDALLRNITVTNDFEGPREVRLMLHQGFRISNSAADGTAQYLPREHAILHYKGRRMFVIRAEQADGTPFDQYSVGIWGIEGHEGTFKDAEDGWLEGNAAEHGPVDSVMRLTLQLDAHQSGDVQYWISAATNLSEALRISHAIEHGSFAQRFDRTAHAWRKWLEPAARVAKRLDERERDKFLKSALIIKSHIDRRGAVIASLDTQMLNYARDAYAYCWPRDAVLSLWPLLRMGYTEEARNFFAFCRSGLQPDGYLMHKYQADRAIGSSWQPYIQNGKPELPIQEDETALVVFLAGQYHQLTQDEKYSRMLYTALVQPMADFMVRYIDHETKLPHASYDLWEQKFLTTTFTTAIVYAALLAAVHMAEDFGFPDDAIRWQAAADDMRDAARETLFDDETQFFYKGFLHTPEGNQFDATIDVSSFYGAFMFGLWELNGPQLKKAHETLLKTFGADEHFNGLPRYVHDSYNAVDPNGLGNPWFVTSLWLAQYYLETNQHDNYQEIVQWVENLMEPSGVISEQVSPTDHRFVSVAPLAWSQAEYLSTILDSLAGPSIKEEHHED